MNQSALERAWYRRGSWAALLLPLSWLFTGLSGFRKRRLQKKVRPPFSVPVVVVGNISVGGTGKTPLLLSIIDYFTGQGFRPGVVSRGYGGKCLSYPCLVTPGSVSSEVGDEPLLYAGKCPVVVDPDRDRAVHYLLQQQDCDVVFSDDGLQHYAMQRDIEIAVIDGQRGFGNGFCLPAGPLREPPERLQTVDFVVVNTASGDFFLSHPGRYEMAIGALAFTRLGDQKVIDAHAWSGDKKVHAVAGIGHPQRFADTLQRLGFDVELHAYPDHHVFTGSELLFEDRKPVVVTAKDAVKLVDFDPGTVDVDIWSLSVAARVDEHFLQQLVQKVICCQTKKTA